MSKFDDPVRKMTAAKGAETSLKWFAEIADKDLLVGAISIFAEVRWGSSTSEGRAAQTYIQQAAKELAANIIELAEDFARADLAVGEKLL